MAFVIRGTRLSLFLLAITAFAYAQNASTAADQPHVGRVLDWTSHHIIMTGGATPDAVRKEPRLAFLAATPRPVDGEGNPPKIQPRTQQKIDGGGGTGRRGVKVDWSVTLGGGNVAPNMFPAKFNFDINGAPSCANDYVVFPLNVAGVTAGQANIVGINNLYSGTGGLCGANPTVTWAYNITTVAGGRVLTSAVISLDGKKIAFVESAGTSSIFHTLTWKAGEGTVAASVKPLTAGGATPCTATTNCLTARSFSGTATDTFAPVWVDYTTDKGFVASDDGKISRISCVFKCTLNTNPGIDWTFTLPVAGTGGAAPQPNGPVYNSPYGFLIVGDQLGEMWVIKADTVVPTLLAGPLMVGGGGCTTTNPPGRTGTPMPCTATGTGFGIPDSAILDATSTSEKIFVFSGNDGTAGAAAVVAQLNQDLTGLIRVHVGQGASVDVHSGAFDNAYWTSGSTGHLFLCGTGPADDIPYHYWIGFTSYPTMNNFFDGNLIRLAGGNGIPCTPYNELFNPNLNLGGVAGHHDLLMSGLVNNPNGYIITNDISLGSVPGGLNFVQYRGGISGIVIDNVSTQPQASSLYFTTLQTVNVGTCNNARCAVKLTQLSLQ